MKKRAWSKEIAAMIAALATAVLVLVVRLGGKMWAARGPLSSYLQAIPDHDYVKATLAGQKLQLEVVNTEQSIAQGLSDREVIGSDGMLFVMPAQGIYPFWMPRMYFDLDIVWLDEGVVVDITRGARAQPGVPVANLPLYTSEKPVNMALEIMAGQADEWGLQIGDELKVARD